MQKHIAMLHPEELYICNFGPIKEARVTIRKMTVTIGEQGSGKSTVAKLYSLFSWLEKALMRHSLTPQYIMRYSRFRKTYAAYNHLESYFRPETELRFNGFHYRFEYLKEQLQIVEINPEETFFSISKVMYVPAERNILGSVDHPSQLKGLENSMKTFLEEYDHAKTRIKQGYTLPFGKVGFEYDVLNDIPKLRNEDFEIKLSAASSGFQSALPLLLVSKNLSEMVRDSSQNNDLSEKEQKALQKEVENIMQDNQLSEEVKKASLRSLSSRYRYSRLVNIVEEMELNLFPDSQKNVLYELMAENNTLRDNRLMLTTHSPYLINYLTLAVKATQLAAQASDNVELKNEIYKIVPPSSFINAEDLVIYELENGTVNELDNYEGLPSDENFLNKKLNDTNLTFDALLDIEERLHAK